MRLWRVLVLPVLALLLFALGTYNSFRFNRDLKKSGKYFWWYSIRLDRDPTNRHYRSPCQPGIADCDYWAPEAVWIDPGWLPRALIVSAFPAFVLGKALIYFFGRLGASELTTFVASMPWLIFAWYCLVISAVTRLVRRRTLKLATNH